MKAGSLARYVFVLALLVLPAAASAAAPLDITLSADGRNPASPQMGDRLSFHSVIRTTGNVPVPGLVAWISLVRVDAGHEQPVDLEDWSALKALTRPSVAPGEQIRTEWPMRLIQAGDYRVVVSAVSRGADRVVTSPFADFHVRRKPVVESRRILPVAFGMPLLMGGIFLVRWARKR
jgi:hypothetical protein